MKAKRHTHKYYRRQLSFGKVWACALPDCTHYMPQHLDELVENKSSLCWQCGERFILHKLNMQDDKPKCDNCRLGIEDNELPLSDKIKEFITGGKV